MGSDKGVLGGVLGNLIDFFKILLSTLIEVLKTAGKLMGESIGKMRRMMK